MGGRRPAYGTSVLSDGLGPTRNWPCELMGSYLVAEFPIHMKRMGVEGPNIQANFDAATIAHPLLRQAHQLAADTTTTHARCDCYASDASEADGLKKRMRFRCNAHRNKANGGAVLLSNKGRAVFFQDAVGPMCMVAFRSARSSEDLREGFVMERVHLFAESANRLYVGFGSETEAWHGVVQLGPNEY